MASSSWLDHSDAHGARLVKAATLGTSRAVAGILGRAAICSLGSTPDPIRELDR